MIEIYPNEVIPQSDGSVVRYTSSTNPQRSLVDDSFIHLGQKENSPNIRNVNNSSSSSNPSEKKILNTLLLWPKIIVIVSIVSVTAIAIIIPSVYFGLIKSTRESNSNSNSDTTGSNVNSDTRASTGKSDTTLINSISTSTSISSTTTKNIKILSTLGQGIVSSYDINYGSLENQMSGIFDPNPSSYSYNSGDYAPQYVEIELPDVYTITSVCLQVNQDSIGQTQNQLYAGLTMNPQDSVYYHSGKTYPNEWINVTFESPLTNIKYLLINTIDSPFIVAWNKFLVYGY